MKKLGNVFTLRWTRSIIIQLSHFRINIILKDFFLVFVSNHKTDKNTHSISNIYLCWTMRWLYCINVPYCHVANVWNYQCSVSVVGSGLLVELMKQAAQTKQFAELDHAIKTKVEPFLYNKGNGKKIPIWKLVLLRNKDRPRHKLVRCSRKFSQK